MGRKGARMGQHLKSLDERAHEKEHAKAVQKRKQKKAGKNKNSGKKDSPSPVVEEIPAMEEDMNEFKFDDGTNNEEGDDETIPSLPDKSDVKERMMKVVHAMERSFQSIRGAEPTPELFESVQVKAYGAMTPLNGVGQVVITSPTRATISPFDPETAKDIRDAVRDMPNMNFNPQIEDGNVIVVIPRVSAETRKVRS